MNNFTDYINKLSDYFKTTNEKTPSVQSSFQTVLETNIMESDSDDEKRHDEKQYEFINDDEPGDIIKQVSSQLYTQEDDNDADDEEESEEESEE